MHTQNINVKTAAQETAGRWGKKPMRTTNIVLTCNLPPLRGLDVRLAWGKALVMRVIDLKKAGEEMETARQDARISGYNDFFDGVNVPPGLYADAPQLVKAWRQGWREAAASEEMAECPGCQNERGEPCPWHD